MSYYFRDSDKSDSWYSQCKKSLKMCLAIDLIVFIYIVLTYKILKTIITSVIRKQSINSYMNTIKWITMFAFL